MGSTKAFLILFFGLFSSLVFSNRRGLCFARTAPLFHVNHTLVCVCFVPFQSPQSHGAGACFTSLQLIPVASLPVLL
ncbi:hypothetical protein GGI35DRAFT_438274 [Trichoderma velutinum]